MAKRGSTNVPSVDEYKRALQSIEATLPKAHRAMLVANYKSKARTITTKQLAKAVGYKNHNAAVLQYGKLGHRLCKLLRYSPTMVMANGDVVWTSILADAPPNGPADEWEWTLRPEVAQALEELGWVETAFAGECAFGSNEDYFRAFEALLSEGIPEKHIGLLKAHFSRPRHTATWAQLAKDVIYPSGDTVNLQYGTLAHRVAEKLGISRPPKGFWLYVLAQWAKDDDPASGHTAFVLRAPVIEALTRLGILASGMGRGTARDFKLREFCDSEGISYHDEFQAWRTAHQDGIFLTMETHVLVQRDLERSRVRVSG